MKTFLDAGAARRAEVVVVDDRIPVVLVPDLYPKLVAADDDPNGYSMSRSRRDSARITRNFARSGSGSVSANDSVKPLAWMSF